MKFPEPFTIDWHVGCLKNQKLYLHQKKEQLKQLQEEIDKMQKDSDFYEQQINAAALEGKTSFQADKFMKTRKKK